MRILHLFANFKWTGPADPAIRCAVELRCAGADVVFAVAGWTIPGAEHRMAAELARARVPVIAGLELRKHFHPVSHVRDARRLRARLDRGDFDVVHAHLLADHLIAALAKRGARRRPIVVRSLYEPEAPARRSWRHRVSMRMTDGVVVPTVACGAQVEVRFGVPRERVLVQDPPVSTARLRMRGDLRSRFGLGDRDFAIGIVARIQPHRRFDLLWQCLSAVVAKRPQARLVLLGRGNAGDTERLVTTPIRNAGLERHVVVPGYLHEPDYSLALRSLDAFLFLVPGSDGTCRAVREAMAVGLPIVTTRRGILPDLVEPRPPEFDRGGFALDEDPEQLAAALIALCDDREARARIGAAALDRVRQRMDPASAARRLFGFYERLHADRSGAR